MSGVANWHPLFTYTFPNGYIRVCSLKPDAAHMPVVKVEPTDEHPIPFSLDEEEPEDYLDQVAIAANTADILEELGAPIEVDDKTLKKEKALIKSALKDKNPDALRTYPAAMAASAFIKNYGHNLAHDVMEVRAALTNKLLEIANCGDTKFELRALELLGKHSDISLFTERSEITVNYKSPEALETAIKERVKRLLKAEVIDMPVLSEDLDDELGTYKPPRLQDESEPEEIEEESDETGEEEGEAE